MKQTVSRILYSVIIPVFNGANTLDACLKSLSQQNIREEDYEIIIIDDASTDNSVQVAHRYNVRVLQHETRKGAYAARNTGIRAAQGEILLFTDASCRPDSEWMQHLLSGFREEGVGCVAGQIVGDEPSTLIQHFCHDKKTHDQASRHDCEIPFFAGGNVAIRREVFAAIGLFDESLESGGDGDFAFRLHLHGQYRHVFRPDAVVHYHYRETLKQLLKQAYKYGKGIARFRMNYRGQPGLDKPVQVLPNVLALVYQLAGALIIPGKIIQEYRRTKRLSSAMFYPCIDKLHSLIFHLGVVVGLIRFSGRKRIAIPKLDESV